LAELFQTTVRVFWKKEGRIKYISHLDINRCMARALKRSRLPVWHTLGFNPHIYTTFALPLALGYESECESVDFRLTEQVPMQEVVDRLPCGSGGAETGGDLLGRLPDHPGV